MKTLILVFLLTLIPACSPAFSQDINFDKLVQAVITVESNGNPHAVSPAGCIGLMQINPRGALAEWNMYNTRQYTIGDLYNPSINVEIGTWYLKRLYHYYKCTSVELICAAYNGGITRLRLNNFNIEKMPKETRDYVKKVMKEYN